MIAQAIDFETAAPGANGAKSPDEPTRIGPIAASWLAVPPAWLTEAPPPRRWLLRHPTRDGAACAPGEGDGVLPLGRVGLLAAAGGAGKTMSLCQLAVSIATGRPWLAHMHVGEPGRVLLGLAEETSDECHRRLYAVATALGLDVGERRAVADRAVVLPLMGLRPALIHVDATGTVGETPALAELRRLLVDHAGAVGWRLVVLDPMTRWLPGAERDNDAATAAMTIAESLCSAPGSPTVLIAAHSSKFARRIGQADTRGVTGTIDAARWEGQLVADGAELVLSQTKSNYSAPWPAALRLARGQHGVLRVLPEGEIEHLAALSAEAASAAKRKTRMAEHEGTRGAILAAVKVAGPNGVPGADVLALKLGLPRAAARAAFSSLAADGMILPVQGRDHRWGLAK